MKSAILLSLHRPTDALAALGQLDGLPAYAALVDYRRGIALGQLGRRDEAFAALERARESGRIDMTQIMSDTTADPLREDPRFRKLLPSEEEYAHPFVENVPLMQEWRGEATGDFFGWIARDVGDVDGDQVHDIVTSAPFARNAAGTVYLLRPGTPEPVWTVEGEPGSRLGTGLEAAGDVNGDGVPDVVAGAPGGDYVLLLSGADGLILRRIAGRQSGEGFGTRVSDFGDFDGDGAADVLVGAPANSRHGTGSGGVYVISGRTGESLLVLHGKSAGDRFGSSLAGRVLDGGWIIAVGTPGAGVGGEVQ
ncbi:MAG: FG-GAP repeat protein, partial [Gemmatimonadetes bacterium]|nr:FG-GAP repeat protein [Gemmatimonadota bacterium]